jgi:hypothetical protein
VPQCHAAIAQLLERVKLLEERISLDSNDSSKPPSSDGPGRANRAQRRASQRKRGAQPGHKVHSRAILAESEVDRMVDCKPAATCECGGPVELAAAPLRHQVFEVPPMRAQVHWYWLYSGCCAGCSKARMRECCVPACPRARWGHEHCLWSTCWALRYHLTQCKTRNLLDQLMGLSFSAGAISQAHGKVAQALKTPEA